MEGAPEARNFRIHPHRALEQAGGLTFEVGLLDTPHIHTGSVTTIVDWKGWRGEAGRCVAFSCRLVFSARTQSVAASPKS